MKYKEFIAPDEIEIWIRWVVNNPELAEKYYPERMKELKKAVRNSQPYKSAVIIQSAPEHFPSMKRDTEQYFGETKRKLIQSYIDWIDVILRPEGYKDEICKQAVEKVRKELTEQREYWVAELGKEWRPSAHFKLTMKQIALLYVYQGLPITRHNGKEIALSYGHTSGDKLYSLFSNYGSRLNRIAKPNNCTAITLRNKINLIESVIDLLPESQRKSPMDEVQILRTILETEYLQN